MVHTWADRGEPRVIWKSGSLAELAWLDSNPQSAACSGADHLGLSGLFWPSDAVEAGISGRRQRLATIFQLGCALPDPQQVGMEDTGSGSVKPQAIPDYLTGWSDGRLSLPFPLFLLWHGGFETKTKKDKTVLTNTSCNEFTSISFELCGLGKLQDLFFRIPHNTLCLRKLLLVFTRVINSHVFQRKQKKTFV